LGGIQLSGHDTMVNGTLFDTKNLMITEGDITKDYNYSIKVMGRTGEVNDSTWHAWFGDEMWDVTGKTIVCLPLIYNSDIANDNNATINISAIGSTTSSSVNISQSDTNDANTNTYYLILNPREDRIEVTINYESKTKPKDIKYLIDLMDVNSDSNSQG